MTNGPNARISGPSWFDLFLMHRALGLDLRRRDGRVESGSQLEPTWFDGTNHPHNMAFVVPQYEPDRHSRSMLLVSSGLMRLLNPAPGQDPRDEESYAVTDLGILCVLAHIGLPGEPPPKSDLFGIVMSSAAPPSIIETLKRSREKWAAIVAERSYRSAMRLANVAMQLADDVQLAALSSPASLVPPPFVKPDFPPIVVVGDASPHACPGCPECHPDCPHGEPSHDPAATAGDDDHE